MMPDRPFIKALATYCGGGGVLHAGLEVSFHLNKSGKSPTKLEVTSQHDHSKGCEKLGEKLKFQCLIIFIAWLVYGTFSKNVTISVRDNFFLLFMHLKCKF